MGEQVEKEKRTNDKKLKEKEEQKKKDTEKLNNSSENSGSYSLINAVIGKVRKASNEEESENEHSIEQEMVEIDLTSHEAGISEVKGSPIQDVLKDLTDLKAFREKPSSHCKDEIKRKKKIENDRLKEEGKQKKIAAKEKKIQMEKIENEERRILAEKKITAEVTVGSRKKTGK